MLNPDIFSRYCKNTGEQREQVEQPREYRRISVPSAKNDSGTQGTDRENVPLAPFAKTDGRTEITASILAVPLVPSVPPKNRSDVNQHSAGSIKNTSGFSVQTRKKPYGFSRVAAALMNRRKRIGGAATPGYGNSGHLKREPYPLQISDAWLWKFWTFEKGTLPSPNIRRNTSRSSPNFLQSSYKALTRHLPSPYETPLRKGFVWIL